MYNKGIIVINIFNILWISIENEFIDDLIFDYDSTNEHESKQFIEFYR